MVGPLRTAERLARELATPAFLRACLAEGGTVRTLALDHVARWLRPDPKRTLAEDWPGRALADEILASTPEDHEQALLLAELFLQFHHRYGVAPLPAWQHWDLPGGTSEIVSLTWLRTHILVDAKILLESKVDERLLQAVTGIELRLAAHPEAVVEGLLHHSERQLARLGVEFLAKGVLSGHLSPSWAHARLREQVRTTDDPQALARVLGLLAEPWAVVTVPDFRVPTTIPHAAPMVAMALLRLASVYRDEGPLLACIDEHQRPLSQRKAAIACWAGFAGREQLSKILSFGADDPMLFGGEAVSFVRVLHRRGLFVGHENIAQLLAIYRGNYRVTPTEIASLTFTTRRAWVDTLCKLFAHEGPDTRLLELAVEIARTGELQLAQSLAENLAQVLATSIDSTTRQAVLRTLAILAVDDAEMTVLDQLFEAPAASLECLRVIGGGLTVAALTRLLGLGDTVAVPVARDPRIVAWRREALQLVWALLPNDAPLRSRIVARVEPRCLPREIAVGLGNHHHSEEWALLELGRRLGAWNRLGYIQALATRGADADGRQAWEVMVKLFRGLVADVATGEVVNHARRGEEQKTIPDTAVSAIRALGARLFEMGRVRPVCLTRATSARDAGERFVRFVAVHTLRTSELHVHELEVVFRLLLEHSSANTGLGAALRGPEILAYLRHPSQQVRKLLIALIRETRGEDLSINLIHALGHEDIETIRQALETLGELGATWACDAIAAKLDHPNMNLKKTAAQALARAGTVEAVPKLLWWLGHHDNAGLRLLLQAALQAILRDGFEAVLLAAVVSAQAQGPSAQRRVLLLRQAGAGVRSPVWHARFADTKEAPSVRPELPSHGGDPSPLEQAIDFLADVGWSQAQAEVVAELVDKGERLSEDQYARLRPRFRNWVEMARNKHSSALSVACALKPVKGWSPEQLEIWQRHLDIVLDLLPIAGETLGRNLLEVVDTLAPRLLTETKRAVVSVLRTPSLPSTAQPTAVARLRAFGAVLCRRDLEDALASAARAANPWVLQQLILQQAFSVRRGRHRLPSEAREELERAVRLDRPRAIAELRKDWKSDARATLSALCEVYHQAAGLHQSELLSWMELLQPLDAPTWNLSATASASRRATPPSEDVLDEPRSSHLQAALVEMLRAEPDLARRKRAAELLLLWPELPCHIDVLEAWLGGELGLPLASQLRLAWSAMARSKRQMWFSRARDDQAVAKRLVDLLSRVDPKHLDSDLGEILELWQNPEGDAIRPMVAQILRSVDVDKLVYAMTPALVAGNYGYLTLLHGQVEATPLLTRLQAELVEDVTTAGLIAGVELVQCPLRTEADVASNRERLQQLREQFPLVEEPEEPDRSALVANARAADASVDLASARRALSALARLGCDDREIIEILVSKVRDGHPRIRLHAHRILRRAASRDVYLETTRSLLTDRRDEVRRTAVRTLGFGRYVPAIGELVGMLGDRAPRVREAVREALCTIGEPALKVLYRAQRRARPDFRSQIEDLIQTIERTGQTES